MKTILCPTDFSNTAKNASLYAAKLAADLDAELLLLHISHVPIVDVNSPIDVLDSLMEVQQEVAMNKLKIEIERLKDLTTATITSQAEFGLAVDGITEKADEVQAFLTVMGTNGQTDLVDRILGTVSNGVVKRNKVPTLVVPNGIAYNGFSNIVFANDHKEEIKEQLKFIFGLSSSKKPKIHVVSVDNSKVGSHYTDEVIAEEGGVKQVCVWSDNIKHGLNQYMERNEGQLLAVKHHHRSFFEGIFHKSTTTGLISDANTPILVFNS